MARSKRRSRKPKVDRTGCPNMRGGRPTKGHKWAKNRRCPVPATGGKGGRKRRASGYAKGCGPAIKAAKATAFARGIQEGFKRAGAGDGVAGLGRARRRRRRRR